MKKVLFILVVVLGLGLACLFVCWALKNYSRYYSGAEETSRARSINQHIPSVSIILPHISSAEDQRLTIIKQVAKQGNYKKIILASVNHFNTGSNPIQIYPKDWSIQSGDLPIDKEIYDNIVSSGMAVPEEGAFLDEHGIKNVLSSLSQSFPDATYTSLIIRDSVAKKSIDDLSQQLYKECALDCLLVASVDFSHYNPIALANVHDQNSFSALASFDYDAIWTAETDSPQCLYLATKFAELNGMNTFELIEHGNTGDVNNSHDTETTSYAIGIFTNQSKKFTKSATFIIGGDTMLDRDVWHNYKDEGIEKVFSGLGKRVFWGADLSLINLEGPVSENPINDDWPQRSLIFNMPPTTITALKFANIDAVSLANNHTLNAGTNGFAGTQNLLKEAGINYAGRQNGFDTSQDVMRIDSGIPLSIFPIDALSNYNQNEFSQAISTEKQAGRFIIIIPHWGTEYSETHNNSQKNLAVEWIEAGADMVVGSHPHVIQDAEIINGKPVIYSLGNLVFDQYFSEETQESLIVSGIVTEDKITLSILPTIQNKSIPSFATGEKKSRIVNKVFDEKLLSNGVKKIGFDTIEIER